MAALSTTSHSSAGGATASTQSNGTGALASGTQQANSTSTAVGTGTEVWSSLLKSVASSRLVPTKDVIILGDPHSGKSTLIELLKTTTSSSNTLAKNADGSNGAGVLPSGPNGATNTGNGSAPVMVEMGTSTGEDNMFTDGQKKNDLALSYSFWNVDDEENEDTVARLGIYQIAGSHKSYHALLKYCFNSKSIADSIVVIVLDWSKPWTFMETLERWVRVLEIAIQQICQEGTAANVAWSKGKALMDELQEKLTRFLQEYTEPQAQSANGASTFSESQTFGLGSTDAVLLPLTEGCLTNNTGVPIVIVCTKSDHINILERELDYKEETFDYIQQSLRTICLKYGASLFYTSIHHPHTFADLRQYILHRLLTPQTTHSSSGTGANTQQQQQQQQPSLFPFRLRAQVVERDQVMVPAGWDTIGKIKVLRNGFDCEGVAEGWDMDMKAAEGGAQQHQTDGHKDTAGARQVYEEVITNPKHSHAPVAIQPLITAEDDQIFLDRFLELQRANERPNGTSAMSGGLGSHGVQSGYHGPPVVGPLGSGYNAMLNSHHSSPPPSMSSAHSAIGSAGARAGVNGHDADDIEGRLKRLVSKKPNGGVGGTQSGLIGPALTDQGLTTTNFMKMMEQGRPSAGPPPIGVGSVPRAGGGAAGTLGGAAAANGQTESAALSNFFQSLITRKGTGSGIAGAGAATGVSSPSAAPAPGSPGSGNHGA
ncbi:hypothetical protein BX616_000435 [Lobosporangium transversale]|uniref:Dynein light intermediate chain-domain-containing protein n=1 Tax=Lobosporangium transversale TaxID=64571 RepID=A0A1Y2GWM8_9FUNG|nr:dynein light intermediate chain-domain-containing protein [Lobosporangium transversale]KAF9919161.1 hypothetical protein BX616_000435 [Lobosporangium transversale]ORZ24955.1 dynein light intermediate chain-domain-containing protein [Lobosporangium transversale]|eukprot:XP_021883936.1 dynein light intermediate chain-domain-containing protein [Lobosporangium transversale]